MTGWIDAHMHVWQMSRGDYGWLTPDLGPIFRDFTIDDIWAQAESAGVQAVILVQAAPSVSETEFLLELAASDRRIAGVVGWIGFEAEDWRASLDALAQNEMLKGIRPMIGDLDDPEWILSDRFADVFETMADRSLVLDLHAKPEHLAPCAQIARRHARLQLVLDHCGKPPLHTGDIAAWRSAIAELAAHSNVACKVSGLLTEAGPDPDVDLIRDAMAHVVACFQTERLLWGSDWPVLELAGSYCDWASFSRSLLAELTPGSEQAIFNQNARMIYDL